MLLAAFRKRKADKKGKDLGCGMAEPQTGSVDDGRQYCDQNTGKQKSPQGREQQRRAGRLY